MLKHRVSLPAFFVALFFLVSCSKELRPPMQRVYISTKKNTKVVSVNGIKQNDLPIIIKSYREAIEALKVKRRSRGYLIQRSNKPLSIVLQTDSFQKTVLVQPRKVYAWLLNTNYLFGPKTPVDFYIGKRWRYEKRIFVTMDDNIIMSERIPKEKKGTYFFTFSPSIPIFDVRSNANKGRYLNAGIFGLQIGADYFYNENKFLSFDIGAATDKLPLDYFGDFEEASTIYTSVRNNIVFGGFDVGYGISFSRFFYNQIYYDSTIKLNSANTTGLGLSFSAHYKLTRNLKVGFLYQPNLLSLNSSPAFFYQHYMAVQCVFEIPTKKSLVERKYER